MREGGERRGEDRFGLRVGESLFVRFHGRLDAADPDTGERVLGRELAALDLEAGDRSERGDPDFADRFLRDALFGEEIDPAIGVIPGHPAKVGVADEFAERFDLGSPALGGRAACSTLDAGLLAVELERLLKVDPFRQGRGVLGKGVRFREVAVPGRPCHVDRDLSLRLHEHGQEAGAVGLVQDVPVPAQKLVEQLLVVLALLVVFLLVAQVRIVAPPSAVRGIADPGLAALLMDDTLEPAEIPVGHGPDRCDRRSASGLSSPQPVLPLLVQIDAQLVAFDDSRLEIGRFERAPNLAAADNAAVPFRHLLAEPPDVALDLFLVGVLVFDRFSDGGRHV